MPKQYLPRTWVSPKLIGGKSKIHGDGVIANLPIKAGEKLFEFGGELVSRTEAHSGDYWSRSVWAIGHDLYQAVPKSEPTTGLDENLNHSCDPNAWLVDEVTVVARRDIAAGEEITMDQATWNFEDDSYTDNKEPCACGALDCRHVLTMEDWKIPALQEKYKGHFHPVVQEMLKQH